MRSVQITKWSRVLLFVIRENLIKKEMLNRLGRIYLLHSTTGPWQHKSMRVLASKFARNITLVYEIAIEPLWIYQCFINEGKKKIKKIKT